MYQVKGIVVDRTENTSHDEQFEKEAIGMHLFSSSKETKFKTPSKPKRMVTASVKQRAPNKKHG